MNKSLKETAQETLDIITRGAYTAPSGRRVALDDRVAHAVSGTVVHRPEDFPTLRAPQPSAAAPRIDVTAETTAEAGRRLVQKEQLSHLVALNFASAKNPGGGFLGGAKAQEEDLARCSALYACLRDQRTYYDANRRSPSLLYTDHIIYSADVPFFRDEQHRLLEEPFPLSIITAPAPNAGAALEHDSSSADEIARVLEARARKVLAVAAHHGHRHLILGAWGCGVFRNDAAQVALAFAHALADESVKGAFERVVFAVYDPGGRNLRAFERQFGLAQL
jgi:uncharacterized protein (TIGR02452 family)